MALRNTFPRSSSLLSMRPRASLIPLALGHRRYIVPPNARQFTVQSGWKLRPLVGFLAVLGGLEICYVVGKTAKPELTKKNEAVTQTDNVTPEEIHHALDEAKSQGVPADDEEKEAYFKEQFSRYEALSEDDSKRIEAAICFYRAIEAFPALKDRSCLYGKNMPPPIADILLKILALDLERKQPIRFPTEIMD